MAIPEGVPVEVPKALYVVLSVELLVCFVFVVQHYLGAFYKHEFKHLSVNIWGHNEMVKAEMSTGIAPFIVLYFGMDVVFSGYITRLEVELFFLAHALWMGVVFSGSGPYPLNFFSIVQNPLTYFTILIWSTGYSLPRVCCLILCIIIMLFGVYNQFFTLRNVVWENKPWKWSEQREDWLLLKRKQPEQFQRVVDLCDTLADYKGGNEE